MSNGELLRVLAPLVVLFLLMYLLMIRPQKKREREVNAMRRSLQVGDSIITIGGLCGKIIKVKEEKIVIEVGADKLKMEFMKWAVQRVENKEGRPEKIEASADEEDKKSSKKVKKAPSVKKGKSEETPTSPEID